MLKQMLMVSVGLFILACAAETKPKLKVVKRFHISSPGGRDYLSIYGDKLYVWHGTRLIF